MQLIHLSLMAAFSFVGVRGLLQPSFIGRQTTTRTSSRIVRQYKMNKNPSQRTTARHASTDNDNNSPTNLPPLTSAHKRVFFVRHGEVINPGGDRPVYYGAQDVELSALGQAEAVAAGDFLQQYPLDVIAASPLKRAIFGAQKVLERQKANDKDVQIYDGFKELDRGAWCGQTKAEIGPDLMARFDACDESVTPEGGESYPALVRRVLADLEQLLSTLQPAQAAALVSHLQVTRCVLSEAIGMPTAQMASLKIATASITCIDYDAVTHQPATVHFSSFKPQVGLAAAKDGAN